jgi:uncharacterized protein YjbI with pentapeptide repeats
VAIIVVVAVAVLCVLVYFVAKRTLWDLAALLIVPLALAVLGFLFTIQQDARQQRIEDQRAEADALQAYLDQMSQLMLENNLRDAGEDSEVRRLAEARTLTVLQSLDDPQRKKNVLRFLYEADLIDHPQPIVSLEGANLQDINLQGSNLSGGPFLQGPHIHLCTYEAFGFPGSSFGGDPADLSGANLSRADLREALLSGVDLQGANLSGADLRGVMMRPDFHDAKQTGLRTRIEDGCATADYPVFENYPHLPEGAVATNLEGAFLTNTKGMEEADLRAANLRGSRLPDANLSRAKLDGADLQRANLEEAILEDASLIVANLEGATVSDKQLKEAKSIEGATMTDGTITPRSLEGATIGPFGTIYPGLYATEEFEPAMSFSVSDGSWRLSSRDTTDGLLIAESEGGELAFTNPSRVLDPSNPSEPKEVPAPENTEEWASWFRSHPNLDTSEPVQVSVGGASGVQIDVTDTSVPDNYSRVLFFPFADGTFVMASSVGIKDRFVIVDVEGETVVINVAAPEDQFDEFLPTAQKVLDTVEWLESE